MLGSELISRNLDLYSYQKYVTLDLSRPKMHTDNAFTEAFIGPHGAIGNKPPVALRRGRSRPSSRRWRT